MRPMHYIQRCLSPQHVPECTPVFNKTHIIREVIRNNFPQNDTKSIARLRSTTKEYPLKVAANNVERRKPGVHIVYENICRKEQTLLDSDNKNEALKAS